jgi:hypothetical protein
MDEDLSVNQKAVEINFDAEAVVSNTNLITAFLVNKQVFCHCAVRFSVGGRPVETLTRMAIRPASWPRQQPAGIALHDGLELLDVERRLDQF